MTLPSFRSELLDKIIIRSSIRGYVSLATEDHKCNGKKSDYDSDEVLVMGRLASRSRLWNERLINHR
jgi:hypothetical protein